MDQRGERHRLLVAARTVVMQRGLAVSNRELAEAIGTSHRMLDYYFGGRQGLMSAVLDDLSGDLMALFESVTPPAVKYRSLTVLADVQAAPELGALWLDVLLRASRGEEDFVLAAGRIGSAWHQWLTLKWGLDSSTADAVIAAYEGSGIICVTRGETAGREALRHLLAALDATGDES